MVFRRDVTLNNPLISDWEYTRRIKQELIDKDNQNNNYNSKTYKYRVYDKVLVHDKKEKI